jgi:hypothetical protein
VPRQLPLTIDVAREADSHASDLLRYSMEMARHRTVRDPACGAAPNCFLPPKGTPVKATVRKIDHPDGRFERCDGTRFDVCIMEMKSDPAISPPRSEVFPEHLTCSGIDEKITIGRHRMVMPRFSFHQVDRMIRRCAREAEECGRAIRRLASAAPAARRDRRLVLRVSSPGGQV